MSSHGEHLSLMEGVTRERAHPEKSLLPPHLADVYPVLEKVLEFQSYPSPFSSPMGRNLGIYNSPTSTTWSSNFRWCLNLSQTCLIRRSGGGMSFVLHQLPPSDQWALMHPAAEWGALCCASAMAYFRLHAPLVY